MDSGPQPPRAALRSARGLQSGSENMPLDRDATLGSVRAYRLTYPRLERHHLPGSDAGFHQLYPALSSGRTEGSMKLADASRAPQALQIVRRDPDLARERVDLEYIEPDAYAEVAGHATIARWLCSFHSIVRRRVRRAAAGDRVGPLPPARRAVTKWLFGSRFRVGPLSVQHRPLHRPQAAEHILPLQSSPGQVFPALAGIDPSTYTASTALLPQRNGSHHEYPPAAGSSYLSWQQLRQESVAGYSADDRKSRSSSRFPFLTA